MHELLSYIISNITGVEAQVSEEELDGFTRFDVRVPKESVGIVIGRGGKTINAIKNILKIKAIKEGVRVDVQVTEA